MPNAASRRGLFFTLFALLLAVVPLSAGQAQVAVNHAPLITSSAPTTVTAGEVYQYTLTATDRDNDQISYRFTASPDGMTLVNNLIAWQPTKVGTYNVVFEATDQQGGYASQAWQITVGPATASIIVIVPNDKPTIVNLGNNQQFVATAYDQYLNEVSTDGLTWSTNGEIGSVDTTGLFKATKGGLGSVSAVLGATEASAGVIVKDIRTTLMTEQSANTNTAVTNQENATTQPATTQPATTEATANTNANEALTSDTNSNTNTSSEEQQPCTNLKHGLIILMLIIYPIMLIIYYGYEKRHRSGGWWLFPFFLTVIGLIIYYKYICPGTYLWWPWLLVGFGVVLTWWYKGRRRSSDFDNQEKLPF